jgi:hypothetical protein
MQLVVHPPEERKENCIMPQIKFATEVQLTRRTDYYLCTHLRTQTRVIITARMKKMIDQGLWTDWLVEDREEIRCLRELGFLIDT